MSEREILEVVKQIAESIGNPVGGAILLKDPFNRMTGPTADYIGASLRDIISDPKNSQVVIKIAELLSVARTRLGNKIHEPGQIPLRIARTILSEAAYSESDIAIEYFGGVLASSRTSDGRDDRGVKIAKVVTSLSSYQLRAHYLIYSTLSGLFSNAGLSFGKSFDQQLMTIRFSHKSFIEAMDMTESEWKNHQIWSHIFDGLLREYLLDNPRIGFDEESDVPDIGKGSMPNDGGLTCLPTSLGAEVFLWAFGHSDKELDFLFSQDFLIEGVPAFVSDAKSAERMYSSTSG